MAAKDSCTSRLSPRAARTKRGSSAASAASQHFATSRRDGRRLPFLDEGREGGPLLLQRCFDLLNNRQAGAPPPPSPRRVGGDRRGLPRECRGRVRQSAAGAAGRTVPRRANSARAQQAAADGILALRQFLLQPTAERRGLFRQLPQAPAHFHRAVFRRCGAPRRPRRAALEKLLPHRA